MGFRYRRRIRIAPGAHVNMSSHGTSWSIGEPGATINVGGRARARATFGIPGSGISYQTSLGSRRDRGTRNRLIAYDAEVGSLAPRLREVTAEVHRAGEYTRQGATAAAVTVLARADFLMTALFKYMTSLDVPPAAEAAHSTMALGLYRMVMGVGAMSSAAQYRGQGDWRRLYDEGVSEWSLGAQMVRQGADLAPDLARETPVTPGSPLGSILVLTAAGFRVAFWLAIALFFFGLAVWLAIFEFSH